MKEIIRQTLAERLRANAADANDADDERKRIADAATKVHINLSYD